MPNYLSPGVYVREVEAGSRPIEGVGTAVAAFVGFANQGPSRPTLVTNWTKFTELYGDFVEGGYLAHAVYGYFANGGGAAYIVRVGEDGSSNGGGGADKGRGQQPRQVPARQGTLGGYKIDETFDHVSTKRGKENVVTAVKQGSKLIGIEELPGAGTLSSAEPASVTLTPPPATPARIEAGDYVGDTAERTGFSGLEAVDEVTMVAVPDLMSAYQRGAIDLNGVQAVQQAIITHCELMGDRVAILDPPPGLGAQQVKEWRRDKAGYDSKYATLYYPWIEVFDPVSGKNAAIPPSGHVAGIWARNDDTRGVHKAPANEVVRGVLELETRLTKPEHDLLNPLGINCIRAFPGRGIRIWGARTLSSDPAWRYLNVRRLFNYL